MIEGYTKCLGHNNVKTFISYNDLFQDLIDAGKLEEAQAVCESYLKPYRVFFGPENHETITSLNNEGWLRQQQGKISEAGELFKQAFEANKKVLRLGHSETLASLENYVSTLYLQGRYEEANAMRQDLVSQKAAAL
jgi:tetratricopeptide (TPR) repeat protein